MYTYLNQKVYCVRRPGRVFNREIAVSRNSAIVTRVEIIPEGYEHVLFANRHPHEGVLEANIPLDQSRYTGCPYCGNRVVFTHTPGCGAMSCHASDDQEHFCPACHAVTNVVASNYLRASNSGFVENMRQLPPAQPENSRALTLRRPQPAESLDLALFNKPFGESTLSQMLQNEYRHHQKFKRLLEAPRDLEPEDGSPWSLFRKRKK